MSHIKWVLPFCSSRKEKAAKQTEQAVIKIAIDLFLRTPSVCSNALTKIPPTGAMKSEIKLLEVNCLIPSFARSLTSSVKFPSPLKNSRANIFIVTDVPIIRMSKMTYHKV